MGGDAKVLSKSKICGITMIFASFGNSPVPFFRMAESIENYAEMTGEEVVVQSGHTHFQYKFCKVFPFMDKDTFFYNLQNCSVAVLQGGWGSISEASEMGVRIVAFPRQKGKEHHHDQIQLVRALEAQGICLGCYDESCLPQLIEKAKSYFFKPINRGSAEKDINDFLNSF